MGIFNSVGQVIKNRKQFKQWEEQDADKQAQREALYEKKQLDEETLKKAAAKGKVIMDVVDIMDTHSEEVSENVETAVMPVAESAAPLVAVAGIPLLGKYFEKVEKDANNKFEEFLKTENGKKYHNAVDALRDIAMKDDSDISKAYWNLYPHRGSAGRIFDKKTVDILEQSKDENVKKAFAELKTIKDEIIKASGKKAFKNKMITALSLFAGAVVSTFIGINILGAKLQVRASRIARWQSREDLKDPKYFVQYTPEQVAQAQNNLEANKDNKEETKKEVSFKGGFAPMGGGLLKGGIFGKKDDDKFEKRNQGFFKTLGSILKDNKKYKEWNETYNPEDKKVKYDLAQEELLEAQKDKEIIQRVTKKINNNAEEYSEDMEVAAGVLIGGTPWLGAGVGAVVKFITDKLKISEKSQNKHFEKLVSLLDEKTAKEAKELRETMVKASTKNSKKGAKDAAKSGAESIENMLANGKYMMTVGENIMQNTKASMFTKLKQLYHFAMSSNFGRSTGIIAAGSLITGIAGALIGLKLQKASARAGRYKAKQEIANDPRNFVGYSEQDFKEVENVKGKKKTFGQKVVETVTFIPRVIKDYIDYEKYRKTEAKQDKKLLNELTKLDVSEQQLNEAKDLQRKVFTTFENVDDKSQEYSESIEAMTEMAAPVLPFMGIAVTATPVVVALVKTFKGGGAHAAEVLTGFFAKHTKFLKGKTSKKILGEVAQNAQAITKVSQEGGLSKVFNDLVAQARKNAGETGNEVEELIKLITEKEEFAKYTVKDIRNLIASGSEEAEMLFAGHFGDEKIVDIFAEYLSETKILDVFGGKIPDITKYSNLVAKAKANAGENGNELLELLKIFRDEKTFDAIGIKQTPETIEKIIKYFDSEEAIAGHVKEFLEAKGLLETELPLNIAKEIVANLPQETLSKINPKIMEMFNNMPNSVKLSEILDDEVIGQISPADIKAKLLEKGFDIDLISSSENMSVSEILDEIIAKIESNPNAKPVKLPTLDSIKEAFGKIDWKQNGKRINAAIKATIESGDWRAVCEKLPNNMLTGLLKKLPKTNITDKQALQIYTNIQTILENIPSEDLNNIVSCFMEAFKKNPVEFMETLRSGKMSELVASKTAVKVAAISTGAWTALTLVLTYAFESIFAGMQKNAGKLGVMTALEELGDEKYYANESNTSFKGNVSQEPVNNVQMVSNKPQSEMLRKMLNK